MPFEIFPLHFLEGRVLVRKELIKARQVLLRHTNNAAFQYPLCPRVRIWCRDITVPSLQVADELGGSVAERGNSQRSELSLHVKAGKDGE